MKEYLLLFRNISGDGQYISTPQDMAEDMPKWQAWIGQIAMQGKLTSTQPICYEGEVISNKGISQKPHLSENEIIAGYILCKADSFAEVEEWGKTCPILRYEHGSVEIREIMPFTI
jgi:hypothetical protein